MKKILRLVRLSIALTLLYGPFGSDIARADDSPSLFYGFMAYNYEWENQTANREQYGFYTLDTDGPTFTAVSTTGPDNAWAKSGGVYADGKFYGYTASGTWLSYTLYYNVVDAATWSVTASNSLIFKYADGESSEAYLVPSDLAYDAIGDKLYATARKFASDQKNTLCEVDRATGKLTRIKEIENLCALTADETGELYGITMSEGKLVKISKTGTLTEVGETGFYPNRDSELTQSATYDFANRKIYWSLYGFANSVDRDYNRNGVYALIEIDPATGAGQIKCDFPHQERITALTLMQANPNSPADITDLSFLPVATESNDAKLTFTVPSATTSGTPLTGSLTVRGYLDDELKFTEDLPVNSKVDKSYPGLTTGLHSFAVETAVGDITGNRQEVTTFFGIDVPATVTGLTLSAADGDYNYAQLDWNPVLTGANGSPVDESKVRYKVVRYPDNTTVAEAHATSTYSEKVELPYGRVWYTVEPYHLANPDKPGQSARSNIVNLGFDIPLSYLQTFDTQSDFNTFSTIDADNNGGDDWESPCWKFDPEYYCAFYYAAVQQADDWLVTPPLALDPQKIYKLSYKFYGYYDREIKMDVATGATATVAGLDNTIQTVNATSSYLDRPGLLREVYFAPRQGDRFIGFHHYSDNGQHLSIDDICVEEIGDARVPAAITDVTHSVDANSLCLNFNAPAKSASGSEMTGTLTVNIYRDITGNPVATLTDVTPGQSCSWTDNNTVPGVNSYTLRADNEYGQGLATETVIDLTPLPPTDVSLATASYINDRQIEIKWTPESESADPVRYIVQRESIDATGYRSYPIIGRDIDGDTFIDDDPLAGNYSEGPKTIRYRIVTVGGAGASDGVFTNEVSIGDVYSLPFTEKFTQGSLSTSPWTSEAHGATWYVHPFCYDPYALLPQGCGVYDLEVDDYYSSSGYGYAFSPKMDLTTMTAPSLTFKLYNDRSYTDEVYLEIGILKDGNPDIQNLGTKFNAKADVNGWVDCSVDLSAYAGCPRASIVLIGYSVSGKRLHVTDININGTSTPSTLVSSAYITGPTSLRDDETQQYEVTVINKGADDADNVALEITVADRVIATPSIARIASGASGSATFSYTPADGENGDVTLTATVKPGSYTISTAAATKQVNVRAANYPYVNDLKAVADGSSINLSWSAPTRTGQSETVAEDFESYDDFIIDGIGGWTTLDLDGFEPFAYNDGNGNAIVWDNYDKPQAYIIFNPSALSVQTPFFANSGDRMALSVGTPYGANNDWLISPELDGGSQLISFYASPMFDSAAENFHVLISRTDDDPDSFVRLNGNDPLSALDGWNLYHFALPEGTRYFAINYVGDKQDGLMIDDILFEGCYHPVVPDGYNVYRNGIKLNDTPVTDRKYADTTYDGTYDVAYTVRPVFNAVEGRDSNEAEIDGNLGISRTAADHNVTVSTTDGMIIITGSDSDITVFNTAGILIASQPAADTHTISVAPGIYIVRTGLTAVKVAVR